jgi:hypothetical protein
MMAPAFNCRDAGTLGGWEAKSQVSEAFRLDKRPWDLPTKAGKNVKPWRLSPAAVFGSMGIAF